MIVVGAGGCTESGVGAWWDRVDEQGCYVGREEAVEAVEESGRVEGRGAVEVGYHVVGVYPGVGSSCSGSADRRAEEGGEGLLKRLLD